MGNIIVNCGLTNTPIDENQEVIMLEIDYTKLISDDIILLPFFSVLLKEKNIKRCVVGTYNNYGWINEIDDEEYDVDYNIFVKYSVFKEMIGIDPKDLTEEELYNKLSLLFIDLRRNPLDQSSFGSRSLNNENYEYMKKLLEVSLQELKKVKQLYGN